MSMPQSTSRQRSVFERFPFIPALGILVALLILNGIAEPRSMSYGAITGLIKTYLALMFLAVAQSFVVFSADIDLSVGAILSLVNVVVVVLIERLGGGPDSVLLACLVGVLVGTLAGVFNGLVVVGLRLQPIVATFATGIVFTGLALWVLPVAGMPVPQAFWRTYGGRIFEIPFVFYVVILLAVFIWLAVRTKYIIELMAVGDNRLAAYQSGLPVTRIRIKAFALCGLLSAFAALCIIGDTASGDPVVGNAMTLYSVAAVVLGGTALSGGSGSLLGSAIGALILGLINSFVFFAGVSSEWQNFAQGVAVLVALMAGVLVTRRISK
ncbi:ABC transporter permease [Hoeflea olei]|uniref:Sugar ABC transporter permease n=1 Tax=Hoeflea olei TaxID=1480615 RepID=A0A1C1Z1G1_9HYPH|nr:ABC transporter permease [Hoeflea olei]OCW59574.1 sugar ABC transporter permease [Hoeflea olei]